MMVGKGCEVNIQLLKCHKGILETASYGEVVD